MALLKVKQKNASNMHTICCVVAFLNICLCAAAVASLIIVCGIPDIGYCPFNITEQATNMDKPITNRVSAISAKVGTTVTDYTDVILRAVFASLSVLSVGMFICVCAWYHLFVKQDKKKKKIKALENIIADLTLKVDLIEDVNQDIPDKVNEEIKVNLLS